MSSNLNLWNEKKKRKKDIDNDQMYTNHVMYVTTQFKLDFVKILAKRYKNILHKICQYQTQQKEIKLTNLTNQSQLIIYINIPYSSISQIQMQSMTRCKNKLYKHLRPIWLYDISFIQYNHSLYMQIKSNKSKTNLFRWILPFTPPRICVVYNIYPIHLHEILIIIIIFHCQQSGL